jgi:hypothetical protein
VRFVFKTDASVLVAQLNQSTTNLLKALVTRWIAYIRLFDFTVCYVLRTKHTAADRLSQRPCTKLDDIDKANKVNINNFINAKLNAFSIAPVTAREAEVDLFIDKYSKDSWRIAKYLTTLQRPTRLNKTKFRSFKRKALQYTVIDSNLYQRARKGIPQRLVVNTNDRKAKILKELHKEFEHKGRESTYQRVADCYY